VLLCFSTISQASYGAVKEKWAPEVQHYIPNVPTILVGTKYDLREEKAPDPNTGKFDPISPEKVRERESAVCLFFFFETETPPYNKTQGEELKTAIGATRYIEISSKTGHNLQALFDLAVDTVLKERSSDGRSATVSGSGNNKRAVNKHNCMLL
jgi:GTPase SAR1 family protein